MKNGIVLNKDEQDDFPQERGEGEEQLRRKKQSKRSSLLADEQLDHQEDQEDAQFILDNLVEPLDQATIKQLKRHLLGQSPTAEEQVDQTDTKKRIMPDEAEEDIGQRRRQRYDKLDQDAVYRDAQGNKITKDQWIILQEEKAKRKKKPKPFTRIHESELEWGGGVKQKEDVVAQAEYEARIAQGPIQQHEMDEELDEELRTRELWEDPFKGESTQKIGKKGNKVSACPFPAPPNRFRIKPGSKWDGRIRGNGFEAKMLEAISYSSSKLSRNIHSAMD